jgi:hypothetical protein
VLRVAQGTSRLPLVIFVAALGFGPVAETCDRQFEATGISTFTMDSFAAGGIVSTNVDQSQLGWFNMTLDLYRSMPVLAAHLGGTTFNFAIGTQVQPIHYRGVTPAMNDVMAGQIDYMIDMITTSIPQIQGGSVVPIAIMRAASCKL